MKNTLLLGLILLANIICAQDTLCFKNTQKLVVFIKEISQTEVKYKKLELPDGPMYVVDKSEIAKIVYKNGYSETVKQVTESTNVAIDNQPKVNGNSEKALFQKITYEDTKQRTASLIRLISQHPNANKQPELTNMARSMRRLSTHRNGTRTGAIIFGSIAFAGTFLYAVTSAAGSSDPVFAAPPIIFGTLGLVMGSASIMIHLNLKEKRKEFVNFYNE